MTTSVSVDLDTSELRALIKGTGGRDVTFVVHDGVYYGIYQELIWHPFMRPAVEKAWADIGRRFHLVLTREGARKTLRSIATTTVVYAKAGAPYETGALQASITFQEVM